MLDDRSRRRASTPASTSPATSSSPSSTSAWTKTPRAGCLHIFPAVLSLARNTAGSTRWARLAIDKNEESAQIAKSLGVSSVPSFVFLADGKVVDKYSGSDRVELMNRVMRFQQANGIRLPQRSAPKRMSTAEAKEIARAARERAKEQGRRSGW